MLTPTRREIVTTPAYKAPPGAEVWGGPRDGQIVARIVPVHGGRGPQAVVLFADGSELRIRPATQLTWLHPAGKAVAR